MEQRQLLRLLVRLLDIESMKRVFYLLPMLFLLLVSGCGTSNKAVDKAAHAVALQAIENRSFIIEIDKFYISSGLRHGIKQTNGSYFQVRDSIADYYLSSATFPRMPLYRLKQKGSVRFLDKKTKKNGDVEYRIQVVIKDVHYSRAEYLLTLFAESNNCYVQLDDHTGYNVIDESFRGKVYPADNKE